MNDKLKNREAERQAEIASGKEPERAAMDVIAEPKKKPVKKGWSNAKP